MDKGKKDKKDILEVFALKILPAFICIVIIGTSLYHHLNYSTPQGYSLGLLALFDILIIIIISPVILHCIHYKGKVLGGLFFYASFLFMVVFENIWILMGAYHILGDAYTINIGFLWFFHVPVNVGLGWFFFNYFGYFILSQAFPKLSQKVICILNGLIAVSFDLWIDPTVVNSHLATGAANFWNWDISLDPKLFTVPIYNYFGWFLGISAFTYIYASTWGENSPFLKDTKKGIVVFLKKMVLGWILLDVGGRCIPIILKYFIPGADICPFDFSKGESISVWIILMMIPYFLLFINIGYFFKRLPENPNLKQDRGLIIGFTAYILLNFGMATSLQMAFSRIYLSLLISISFSIFSIVFFRYVKNARNSSGSDEVKT